MTERAPGTFAFVFDQHVNGLALKALRAQGVDVIHVGEAGLAQADDLAILRWAQRERRIVVTRNCCDFAPLVTALAARGERFPGVLFYPPSIRQSDSGAHVRALVAWLATARAAGVSPVEGTYGWLG